MDFDAADLEAMAVADLKAFIANNGGTAHGLLYKSELVATAKELAGVKAVADSVAEGLEAGKAGGSAEAGKEEVGVKAATATEVAGVKAAAGAKVEGSASLTPSPASAAPAAPTLPPPSPLNPYKLDVPGMERACEGVYLMEDW